MNKIKNIVVGAGFSGAVIANLLAEQLNEEVLIIDKKEHIAGNCYDYRDKNGIMIHKYGSHIFHTNNEKVWNFVRKFADFNQYMHKVVAVIDGIQTTIPFNFNTLYDVFPQTMAKRLEEKLLEKFEYNKKVPILEFQKQDDDDLKFLANYVYEKVFLHYTTKQWGVSPNEVDGAVTARVPVYLSKDSRYFQDKYQGIPLEGYTKLIENMLNHQNIKVKLNTDYKDIDEVSDRVFYTGAIDEYFDYCYGKLEYRTVRFETEILNTDNYQGVAVVNYTDRETPFTRVIEHKHFEYGNQYGDLPKTVISREYSTDWKEGMEPYYPVNDTKNQVLYEKYLYKALGSQKIVFDGRLGAYKYYDMDKVVLAAMQMWETLRGGTPWYCI